MHFFCSFPLETDFFFCSFWIEFRVPPGSKKINLRQERHTHGNCQLHPNQRWNTQGIWIAGAARKAVSAIDCRSLVEVTLAWYKINRLDYGLQSGTSAYRDGADIDWVVGAVLHDIVDGLASQNHDRMSAEVIRPFVRWDIALTVEHHGIFQMV